MVNGLSAYRVLGSPSRVEILAALQQSGEALPVHDIAETVGLHVNTAREHLDRLVASGFVESHTEVRATRGRPRLLYRAADRPAAAGIDLRAREHLTRLLVEGYGRAMESPGASAEAAGQRWAQEMPAVPHPERHEAAVDEACPIDGECPAETLDERSEEWAQLAALEEHFEELGFRPEADPVTLEVQLRRCPFYDLARERTEVVCGVHLGLARGVLAREGGPLTADRLEPFVGPRQCVLHLRRSAPAPV
ncbi:MAG: helix-turn-helix domain-containing protein [Cellulomonadaceae bacterium]|nr:helix-turn-helix domain-containing protein [Cellulomonadaceae bacterium]